MSDNVNRYIQLGDWCFELKMVRALKVEEYGKPYGAIANCNINGDSMYIDGLVTKDGEEFTKDDFMTFYRFTEMLGLDNFSYHRYQEGNSVTREVKVKKPKKRKAAQQDPNYIKLVQ
ncbi:hypothetical protein DXX93_04920 [Thalassotalea euphylliae]|uniref:Uncharacterized protein n=1 Tax=Thalassotalea euphylliae TaxID=1655234 RepID=A0A3E0TN21_9GAMM|nr:hypothetical protein [Thalassotalea euphylliae]REL25969.1 hypothetical protein DXX93_04920 [Thalassotalea euphylliae]